MGMNLILMVIEWEADLGLQKVIIYSRIRCNKFTVEV